MLKVKRTGNLVTDLGLGTGAILFGALILLSTAFTGTDRAVGQGLFAAAAVFITVFGAMLMLDLRINNAKGQEYLPSTVLVCGGLFLLFAADRTTLVLYALILVFLVVGIQLIFGRPTVLKLDFGDRTRDLAVGFTLIILALLAAFFSYELLDYTAAIFALFVLAGGIILAVSAIEADRKAPRA